MVLIDSGAGPADATIQQRGLVPRLTRLAWIPSEQLWLGILPVARRSRSASG
ncbi:hypothetical protein ABIA38_009057 [Embleya sp. AB8]